MGLLKITVFSIQYDLAVKEVKNVDSEFGGESDGEPDAVRLRSVGDSEAEAWEIRSQQCTDDKRNLARHPGTDQDRLKGRGVDVGVATPAKVAFVLGAESDVEYISIVETFAADHAEGVAGLVL